MPPQSPSSKTSIALLLSVFLLLFVKGMEEEENVFPLEKLSVNFITVSLFPFLNGEDLEELQLLDKHFYKKLTKAVASRLYDILRLQYGNTLPFLRTWNYKDLIFRLPQMKMQQGELKKTSILQMLQNLIDQGLNGTEFKNAYLEYGHERLPNPYTLILTYENDQKELMKQTLTATWSTSQSKLPSFQLKSHWRGPDIEVIPEFTGSFARSGHKYALRIDPTCGRRIIFWTDNKLPFFPDEEEEYGIDFWFDIPAEYEFLDMFVREEKFYLKLKNRLKSYGTGEIKPFNELKDLYGPYGILHTSHMYVNQ